MLGGFTLASWGGPWGDPGTLGFASKDTWRPRPDCLLIFCRFRDPILGAFWVPWTKNLCLFMLVSNFLFLVIFGSESRCLGLEEQAFGKGGVATNNSRRNWISYDPMVHFS